jgi:glucose/arabinose dehydrogenase
MKRALPPILSFLLFASLAARAQTSFTVGSTTVIATTVATDLDVPWDMVLGPDGWIWFTQAGGEVYRLHPDNGTLELIYTVPDVVLQGFTAGLHSMAFHPDFANQPYVYLHYCISNTQSVVKRFYYDATLNTFTSMSPHLLGLTLTAYASHNGSRMVVDDQGMFILTMGDHMSGSANVQNMALAEGKFLRFDPEGGIPADNPIPGSYVYNWGHRNPQGLTKASNGRWYSSAHGAGLDDEVNLVLPNRNYGWPSVAGLCNTPSEQAYCEANDVMEPIYEFSDVVVAPSGIDYYGHIAIPEWENSILVCALRTKELWQLKLNTGGDTVISASSFLTNTFGRLRDVLAMPDGRVFISTSNYDWAGIEVPDDDRIIELRAEAPTAITSVGAEGLHIAPNPASDIVRIERGTGHREDPALTIIDAAGRLVLDLVSFRGETLDVSRVPDGCYELTLRWPDGGHAKSVLVVQR